MAYMLGSADDGQHPLEARASLLAQRLGERVNQMATMMRPQGQAIFSQRLSENKAMDWWSKHRFDDLGKAVMSTWPPDQIMKLDAKLGQYQMQQQMGAPAGEMMQGQSPMPMMPMDQESPSGY